MTAADGPPTADEVLREAERRIEARRGTSGGPKADAVAMRDGVAGRSFATRANRAVYFLARHWIALFNAAILLYLGGAILAPVAMHLGRPGVANVLYTLYGPFCHQYPFRSFFLFGDAATEPLREPVSVLAMAELSHFVGDPQVGYKIALCQRDVAIYAAMLAAGIIYGPLRRRVRIPALPLWLFFLFGALPMFLDGGIQWLSYAVWQFIPALLAQPFETIPAMRVLTGALFGLGVTAVGYPTLAEYFDDTRATLERKYGWGSGRMKAEG